MKRIILDVGWNIGQTIEFVLRPCFAIDKIIGFEPSPICLAELHRKYDHVEKVKIMPFGLSNATHRVLLHNEGSQGGTILEDYQTTCNPAPRITECDFVRASEWFKENLAEQAEIFLKMNCEGSECDIVLDLLDSGEYSKVKYAFIDYDVRKSSSRSCQERQLKQRLSELGLTNLKTYMGSSRNLILIKMLARKS